MSFTEREKALFKKAVNSIAWFALAVAVCVACVLLVHYITIVEWME